MQYHQHLVVPYTAEDAAVLNFIIRKHGDESLTRLHYSICMHNDYEVMFNGVEEWGMLRYYAEEQLQQWQAEQYEEDEYIADYDCEYEYDGLPS